MPNANRFLGLLMFPTLRLATWFRWRSEKFLNPPSEAQVKHRFFRQWWSPRRRWIAFMALVLGALLFHHARENTASMGDWNHSVASVLRRRGLEVEPKEIVWIEQDSKFGWTPVLFLGKREGEESEVYGAYVRKGPKGLVTDVSNLVNLTRTRAFSEEGLVFFWPYAAFLSRSSRGVEAIVIFDLRGIPKKATKGWSWIERVQYAITNWQKTGRFKGIEIVRLALPRPEKKVEISIAGGLLGARLGEKELIEFDLQKKRLKTGEAHVQAEVPSIQGGIAWVVDTVRAWVGPEPIEWLEHFVFNLRDRWERLSYRWLRKKQESSGQEALIEMKVRKPKKTQKATLPFGAQSRTQTEETEEEKAELQWKGHDFPPPPIHGMLVPPIEGEGKWVPLADDPFVNAYPGAPPAFAQTFIRVDPERPYVKIYIVLWDPRQVQLRIVAGTREPESARGEFGTGSIPRDPYTLRWLVAAFNGGFQAMHGEFGMMSEGRVYLPPKPWAATVAVRRDGRVGMGSWPGPNWKGDFDEERAIAQIPEDYDEYRQNLTSVVENGQFNPWKRWWWGAAPPNAKEQTYTHRSGLCLTQEGFMAYFWGPSMGPEAMGAAMIAARCVRGMHLDMNSAHCGFEFFRPYRMEPDPFDPPLPPLDGIEPGSEYDGPFPNAPGFAYRARKAVRSMAMRFPRYTNADPRDFFYLVLRPTLPGPPLRDGTRFSMRLPEGMSWPPPFGVAEHPLGRIVRIDPRRAIPQPLKEPRHLKKIARIYTLGEGSHALFARPLVVGLNYAVDVSSSAGIQLLKGPLASSKSKAAIGVDRDGFLTYVEGSVLNLLELAGVKEAIEVPEGALSLSPPSEGTDTSPALYFFAEEAPPTEILWPENRPLPYSKWGFLQDQRVRYFRTEPPRFSQPSDGSR
ncbi:MAG: hypothetical protein RMJ84_11405 [Sandaracinaceae bacterium]|nr:hypothetical protein [Sandaracinaceae bacterium]